MAGEKRQNVVRRRKRTDRKAETWMTTGVRREEKL